MSVFFQELPGLYAQDVFDKERTNTTSRRRRVVRDLHHRSNCDPDRLSTLLSPSLVIEEDLLRAAAGAEELPNKFLYNDMKNVIIP
jgi:hypothetical protein